MNSTGVHELDSKIWLFKNIRNKILRYEKRFSRVRSNVFTVLGPGIGNRKREQRHGTELERQFVGERQAQ